MANPDPKNLELMNYLRYHCTPEDLQQVLDEMMDALGDDMEGILALTELVENLSQPEKIKNTLDRFMEPVDIKTFMYDPYFLGLREFDPDTGLGVFPEVERAATEIVHGGYVESLLMGGIGLGKTTLAQIVQAYHLYDLSTLVNPQEKFGLFDTSSIVMVMLNRTDELAKAVTFGEFRQMIEDRPYFNEHFSFPKEQKSKMEFPRNIKVIPSAAYSTKLLGMNVIGGIIDEMNFMNVIEQSKNAGGKEFNQAVSIYNTLVRRRKSRFNVAGRLPGCLCMVSSKGGPDDFTEKRKIEVERDEEEQKLTHIWDKAIWEVRPRNKYKAETFMVELGNERLNSRILQSIEDRRPESEIIHVPMDFIKDFTNDMDGSLRDFAGKVTLSKKPFFYDRERIWKMADNYAERGLVSALLVNETDLSEGLPKVNPLYVCPHPDKMRVVHVDLGLTNDAVGLACGYVMETKLVRSRGRDGEVLVEEMPVVAYDAIIRVTPQQGKEIDFDEIRTIIYRLRDSARIPIRIVTYDNFQSVDSRQLLAKRGFATGYMSVDGKDGREIYRAFRGAVMSERVLAPEHYTAFVELSKLEENVEKKLVDHPAKGSKDTADAMAGVFATLMKHRASWAGIASTRPDQARPRSHGMQRPQGIRRPDKATKERPE